MAVGLDFLGAVENKKLVPAVSAFRRLLKKLPGDKSEGFERQARSQRRAGRQKSVATASWQGKAVGNRICGCHF